jgi:hypothetical protein
MERIKSTTAFPLHGAAFRDRHVPQETAEA